jgi:hypothetical protein
MAKEGRVGSGCPTFSWTALPSAQSYLLMIYAVGSSAAQGPGRDTPILRAQIPGGATAWTPELGECLAAGRYGWAVAAAVDGKQGLLWSRPAVFRVEVSAAVPTPPPPPANAPGLRSSANPLPNTLPGSSRSGDATIRTVTAEAFAPEACSAGGETFTDVPASDPFCRWIEQLARDGITQGCGGGRFCPDGPVTRRQLAMALEQ